MDLNSRFGLFLLILCKLLSISASYSPNLCKRQVTKKELRLKASTRTRMGQKLECVKVWSNYCHYVPSVITDSILITVPEQVTVTEYGCCDGYKELPRDWPYRGEPKCEPICTNGCTNGKCVDPEVCECNENFEFETYYTCKPICINECINSICSDVNHCECLPNYVYHNESMCLPKCDKPCINGTCIKPNICECIPHHIKTNDNVCEPECELDCTNGKCIDVNKCGCHDGYELRNNTWHICDPVCLECQNGYCASPNNCTCFEGYEPDEKPEICNPICDEICVNGYCSEPNVCSCNEGYALTNDSVCEPICENGCEQGFCAEPHVCECFENYVKETSNKCVPYCENCINGYCAEPSYCQCYIGTVKLNSSYCANVCDGNTTEECYHVEQTFQEYQINLFDDEIVMFPKNDHILTLKSSCIKNITFDCILDKIDDELYSMCQIVQNDTDIEIKPLHESNYTSINQTTAYINFTFIYEKENTTELCKLCFCDNYNMEVNTGYFNSIILCPCQDIIKTNKLQASHVSVIHVVAAVLGCSILIILGIMGVMLRKKMLEGVYRIGTNMQENALIEDEL